MQWIKFWVNKWLTGATRWELTPDERSVWVDFLCLAGNSSELGCITFFSLEQLSYLLHIDIELLTTSIEKFIKYKKITDDPNRQGDIDDDICFDNIIKNKKIYIINWDKYQRLKRD